MEKKKIIKKEEMFCHDCGRELKEGTECMPYDTDSGLFLKCRPCHEEDPALRNYQKCEVYSRIVGYIRPVQQWNPGKKEEFKDRVDYNINKECEDEDCPNCERA